MSIDIIYISLIVIAIVIGFSRGLIASIFSLLAIVISVLASVHFSKIVSVYLQEWFNWQSPYMPVIVFIIICIAVILIFRLLGKAIEGVFSALQLTLLNKLAGAVLWTIAITMLFSTLVWYGEKIGLPGEKTRTDSKTYSTLLAFAPLTNKVVGYIIPPVKNIFNNLNEWFDALGDQEISEPDTSVII